MRAIVFRISLVAARMIPTIAVRRLCFLFLACLAGAASTGYAQIQFCGGVMVQPGGSFVDISGTQGGLASGMYRMTIQQTGPFTIQSLQASWNGIAAGNFQAISGNNNQVALSGIVPPGAVPGQAVTVTFSVMDIAGRIVQTGTSQVTARGSSAGWTKVWDSGAPNGGLSSFERFYVGDFDGNGAEDILAIGPGTTNVWMVIFTYQNGNWQWLWSNNGDPNAGGGIYPYRNNLVVGDFDADGKDEVLGTGGWMTMFKFGNNTWNWYWSNNGNANYAISPYAGNLIAGDFDGVLINGKKRDELLGTAGNWLTMFHFQNANFQGGWTNYGVPGGGISDYRNTLRAGDFDGDGQDELLGLANWATLFDFINGDWYWSWSNNGGGSFGGWGYPLWAGQQVIVGNIDTDPMAELLFIQTGPAHMNAGWATTMDFANGAPNWRWSNNGTPPFLGDWPVINGGANNAEYLFVKAVASDPSYLLARRRLCGGGHIMRMYKTTNPPGNF